MAKLTELPSMAIISGFRGVIDFYVNHQSCDPEFIEPGIICARRWPRSPGHSRSPAVEAQWPVFRQAASLWNQLSPAIHDAYIATAASTTLTARDLFTKSYIADYFRPGQWGEDYEHSPPVEHFAILDILFHDIEDGYEITVITNNPCHLFVYHTKQEPWVHKETIISRGVAMPLASRYCFTAWDKNEQEQLGDTFIHTFIKVPWPYCETWWFTFRAQFDGKWSNSVGPIFKKHHTPSWGTQLINEPWTWLGVPPPSMITLLITEPWTWLGVPPPEYELAFTEPWSS